MTDITTRGEYQQKIRELPDLESYDFENIFKLCFDPDKSAYFYNIIKTVNVPNTIDRSLFITHTVHAQQSMTALSYSIYGTPKLWWLICVVNNISNPVQFLPAGASVKAIKPRHISYVVDLIKQNLVD